MLNELKTFLKTTFVAVRSAKRTDALHNALLSEFLKKYPKYKKYNWKFEYNLRGDAYGGTFKIDIIGFNPFQEFSLRIAIILRINLFASSTVSTDLTTRFRPARNSKLIIFLI